MSGEGHLLDARLAHKNFVKKKAIKHKITKRRLDLNIFEIGVEDMTRFAETPQGASFGIYPAPDGNGVTFGKCLDSHEHFGEGLPELEGRETLDKWHLDLDIRVSFDHSSQATCLEVSRKGSGTFHRIDFTTSIELWKAQKATGRFNNLYEMFLINYGCLFLMQNLLWEQSEDQTAKDVALEGTVKSFEVFFKSFLKPGRFKETAKTVKGGITVTTFEKISGRPLGTKGRSRKLSERESDNQAKRKSKIVAAIRTVVNNENKTDLAKGIGITRPTLNTWLKSIGVDSTKRFYDLIRDAESE